MRHIIVIILLSSIHCLSFAKTDSYKSINAFVTDQSTVENKAEVIISSEDDLNNDGIKDWVGIIAYGSPIQNLQIFILYGKKNGSYAVSGNSKAFEYGGYAIGDGEITEVKKRSKNSFSVGFSAGASTFKYICKLHDMSWDLVGEDYTHYSFNAGAVNQFISINYMTGNFISTKLVNGKNKTIRGNRKYPIFPLYEFDYYNPYGMEEFWQQQNTQYLKEKAGRR